MFRKSLDDHLELTYKINFSIEKEFKNFGGRVIRPNKGIYCEGYNLDSETVYSNSKKREYIYHLMNSTVVHNINSEEKEMKFKIYGEGKQEVYNLVKEAYKNREEITPEEKKSDKKGYLF